MPSKIIICNVDNECMLGDIRSVPPVVFESTAIISFRLLWLAQVGDVVILPRAPSLEFVEYIKKLSGIDFSAVRFVVPEQISNSRASITGEILLSCDVLAQVREALATTDATKWHLLPYYFTPAVGRFGREIAQDFSLSQPPFNSEGGAELLNQKTVFRKIAAGIGVPFALGTVVNGFDELLSAVELLLDYTGTVIIKQDRSGGGEGNYAITSTEYGQFKGVSKVLPLLNFSTAEASRMVINELATKGNEALTVEVYYGTTIVVYSEYHLDKYRSVDYLNHGVMRMWPLWSGFEIPGSMPAKAQSDFIHQSTKLAMLANELGYRGHLNIDAVVTDAGDVIFTEINGRTGGCTHVHIVAQHLIGCNYLNTHQITTFNKAFVRSLPDYLDLLTEHTLHFSRQAGRGVVVLSADQRGEIVALELMFVGADLDDVSKVESIARMLADSIRVPY